MCANPQHVFCHWLARVKHSPRIRNPLTHTRGMNQGLTQTALPYLSAATWTYRSTADKVATGWLVLKVNHALAVK